MNAHQTSETLARLLVVLRSRPAARIRPRSTATAHLTADQSRRRRQAQTARDHP